MNQTTVPPVEDDFNNVVAVVFAAGCIGFLCLFACFIYFCCHKTSLIALLWFRCIGHRFYSRIELQELSDEVANI